MRATDGWMFQSTLPPYEGSDPATSTPPNAHTVSIHASPVRGKRLRWCHRCLCRRKFQSTLPPYEGSDTVPHTALLYQAVSIHASPVRGKRPARSARAPRPSGFNPRFPRTREATRVARRCVDHLLFQSTLPPYEGSDGTLLSLCRSDERSSGCANPSSSRTPHSRTADPFSAKPMTSLSFFRKREPQA